MWKWKTRNYKIKQYKIKDLSEKFLSILYHQKNNVFLLCMYKMYTFIIKTWSEIDVEAIKYNGEKWINEKHLKTAVGYKNLTSNKTQYYSDEF